jgi:hypothetical protein
MHSIIYMVGHKDEGLGGDRFPENNFGQPTKNFHYCHRQLVISYLLSPLEGDHLRG